MSSKLIRIVKVFEDETVEIQWTLRDNSVFITRHTIPPKSTREHKEEEKD